MSSLSDSSVGSAQSTAGSSTYSTGGGGFAFAYRVAAVYLASMLTGSRRHETKELPIHSVAFQTGPAHQVDDLLIKGGDRGEEVELAVACRATPKFIPSHTETVKLVRSLLGEIATHPEAHVAIAVAGSKPEWGQVAALCDKARDTSDADSFHAASQVERRWSRPVRDRYRKLREMVQAALDESAHEQEVIVLTWGLLRRLRILEFRLQSPDETDWTAVASILDAVANSTTDGIALRNHLVERASAYDPAGAVVDLNLLRTQSHQLLDTSTTRTKPAWEVLHHYRAIAYNLRNSLGPASDTESFELPFIERRAKLADAIRGIGADQRSLVVSGASGTGKSSLVLSAIADVESSNSSDFEAIVVNFRELPQTSGELRQSLGVSIGDIMAELSAPERVLVIDGADAAAERSAGLFLDLVAEANKAGLGIVAVAVEHTAGFVREQIALASTRAIQTFEVEPLSDSELAAVASRFPQLQGLLASPPTESLLRRLVVLDLLSRTGITLDNPLGEWDCLQLIWTKIVRGEGRKVSGSRQAREDTLLTLAKSTLNDPHTTCPTSILDGTAVDALRDDHLLAPANPFESGAKFAHDEIRRYATAMHLIGTGNLFKALQEVDVPRWSLSATTLACKGLLVDSGRRTQQTFAEMVAGCNALAATHGGRWSDVPIEAVLETPTAYDCIKMSIEADQSSLELSDVLRVVQQRLTVAGLIHPALGSPVIRYLLDHDEPWATSDQAYEVLVSWLQSLIVSDEPQGNALRQTLRAKLHAYWEQRPQREDAGERTGGHFDRRRSRRNGLDYRVTSSEFVETLALLGLDTNTEIKTCLDVLAVDAPTYLRPAVDEPFSARSLSQYDPEFLAHLVESYYIDEDTDDGWGLGDDGIRGHKMRSMGFGPPFAAYWFGAFWQLFNTAKLTTSVRVLNNILNHAAQHRVDRSTRYDRLRQSPDDSDGVNDAPDGVELNITGESRNYVGDGAIWSWYRGTTTGPYPCMSALQAMERVIERLVHQGVDMKVLVEYLLRDCQNLAVPGMLYGLLVRNIENSTDQLDRFLATPAVWLLEPNRTTYEHFGFRASDEGLANPERRKWTAREVAMWLVANGDEERRDTLRAIGQELSDEGIRQGFDRERVLNWATTLDASSYQITSDGENLYLQATPPPEVEAANAEIMAQHEQVQEVLRLQNRYWGLAKIDNNYEKPTAEEIAHDLRAARELLEAEQQPFHMPPGDAVAQVVRAALERAASGQSEVLGGEEVFAVEYVMRQAAVFVAREDPIEDHQDFELGADRAIARALPALLTTSLEVALKASSVSTSEVIEAGYAIASKAPKETRMNLARGCDPIWKSACLSNPCIHHTALDWIIETARNSEVGPWDFERQVSPKVRIDGDVSVRLEQLDGESIAVDALTPSIRGLGAAAANRHCAQAQAGALLARLLRAQGNAMVRHEGKGWTADYRGENTLAAARSLLHNYAEEHSTLGTTVLDHLDVLRGNAKLLANFLHALAGSGAENQVLAQSARGIWPELLVHALTYASDEPSVYEEQTWGPWAAAALLPNPPEWSQGMYSELDGEAIDWVQATELAELIGQWLPVAQGQSKCVDALIRILRQLPLWQQVTQGLDWVSELCIQDGKVTVDRSWFLNDWLKEIRTTAEEQDSIIRWQSLVDALVVAGNSGLAAFSR